MSEYISHYSYDKRMPQRNSQYGDIEKIYGEAVSTTIRDEYWLPRRKPRPNLDENTVRALSKYIKHDLSCLVDDIFKYENEDCTCGLHDIIDLRGY